MTRVAIVADSHFDETSRFDECVEVHDWIADDIAERHVDLVLHSGDVFERKSTPRERLAVRDWLRRVTECAPVVMVRGNHDSPNDLTLFEALETKCPIRVVEGAELVSFGGFDCGRGIDVACMAWPRKAELLSRLGDVSHEQGDQVAVNELRNVLRGLGVQRAPEPLERPLIFLGHVQTRASRVSTGQPLVGCDFELGLEDLALIDADFYALGHIHLGQEWTIDDAPVVYPGSPRRTAFGETESKGYLIADFDGPRLVGWERIATPCAPMVLLEGEYHGPDHGLAVTGMEHWSHLPTLERAEIRLRYRVEADQRDGAKAAAEQVRTELLERGAALVKLEAEVIPQQRARVPELAKATSLEEKLVALWRARSDVPEAVRQRRLFEKVRQLESEAG